MTDLQIALILVAAAGTLYGYLILCERVQR
jgi:hypothetical protein